MRRADVVTEKIYSPQEIARRVMQWRWTGKSIAFTNGVFDILHAGHIYSISEAAGQADLLIVGLNSDASVKRLKGPDRPVHDQDARALMLASLVAVDAVVIFGEDTPLELIRMIRPDVLVKGGDYSVDQIAGAKEVQESGGRVHIHPILEGHSTTSIIERIRGK